MVKLPEVTLSDLPNGLKIAVVRSDAAPLASVQLWIRAGSRVEPSDRHGLAGLVEHLMARGSQHVRDGAHQSLIASVGGQTGSSTDEDAVHFSDNVPAADAALAIQLEADRLRGLILRPEAVAAEREVVADDARRAEANPLSRGFLKLLATAFTTHPYRWTSNGSPRDLDATTLDDAKKFYDAYYQPNNAILVVVGDVDPAAIQAAAQKYFGGLAKGPDLATTAATEPPQSAARREQMEPGQVGIALVGYRTPAAGDVDAAALQVAGIVLGGGDSSRMRTALLKPAAKGAAPLARDAGIQIFTHQDPGIAIAYGIYVAAAQGDAIESAIAAQISALSTKGPTAAELRKAKNQVESAFVFSLENTQGVAETLGRAWIDTGDPKSAFGEVDRVEAVTVADVKRVVGKYMAPAQANVVIVPPAAPTGGGK